MIEIWKPVTIHGYESLYEVSDRGRIRSKRKVLSPRLYSNGYRRINFSCKAKKRLRGVHRVVALAFIPNPDNKPCVNHIDFNKENNSVENLQWVTDLENIHHSARAGRTARGEMMGSVKLTEKNVRYIRLNAGKIPEVAMAKMFDVTRANISAIILRKSWKHI